MPNLRCLPTLNMTAQLLHPAADTQVCRMPLEAMGPGDDGTGQGQGAGALSAEVFGELAGHPLSVCLQVSLCLVSPSAVCICLHFSSVP